MTMSKHTTLHMLSLLLATSQVSAVSTGDLVRFEKEDYQVIYYSNKFHKDGKVITNNDFLRTITCKNGLFYVRDPKFNPVIGLNSRVRVKGIGNSSLRGTVVANLPRINSWKVKMDNDNGRSEVFNVEKLELEQKSRLTQDRGITSHPYWTIQSIKTGRTNFLTKTEIAPYECIGKMNIFTHCPSCKIDQTSKRRYSHTDTGPDKCKLRACSSTCDKESKKREGRQLMRWSKTHDKTCLGGVGNYVHHQLTMSPCIKTPKDFGKTQL